MTKTLTVTTTVNCKRGMDLRVWYIIRHYIYGLTATLTIEACGKSVTLVGGDAATKPRLSGLRPLLYGLPQGTGITVTAEGPDASAALDIVLRAVATTDGYSRVAMREDDRAARGLRPPVNRPKILRV